MKAHRKFARRKDSAVSPVIAVILMVAITVVLAATVYVWVSGFGVQSSQPAKSVSLTSAGTLTGAAGSATKLYSVAAATNGMKWSDITVTVNGATKAIDNAATCGTTSLPSATTKYEPCHNGAAAASSAVIIGGDSIGLSGLTSGDTLRIVDAQANSVLVTLTVG